MRTAIVSLCLTLGLIPAPLRAHGERAAYSNENAGVFIMPREAALAGADICFSRDAARQSNPASVPLDSTSSLAISYAGYYENAFSSSNASYVTRILDHTGIGVSLGYLYVPDILITENFEVDAGGEPVWDPSRLDYASASDILLNLVYARRLEIRRGLALGLGGRLHALRRRLPGETGYGIGLDAGAVLDLPRKGLRFSLLLNDLTTNYIYWGSSYDDLSLPAAQLGVGWGRAIPYFYGRFKVFYRTPDVLSRERLWYRWDSDERGVRLVDEHDRGDAALSFLFMGRYGLEYVIREVVALRGGFTSGRASFGGGISLFSSALHIDFSYTASELSGTYHVSAGCSW